MDEPKRKLIFCHRSRKSRKVRQCCECGESIKVGEVYHIHKCIWGYHLGWYANCADCEALRGMQLESVPYGQLYEHIKSTKGYNG